MPNLDHYPAIGNKRLQFCLNFCYLCFTLLDLVCRNFCNFQYILMLPHTPSCFFHAFIKAKKCWGVSGSVMCTMNCQKIAKRLTFQSALSQAELQLESHKLLDLLGYILYHQIIREPQRQERIKTFMVQEPTCCW